MATTSSWRSWGDHPVVVAIVLVTAVVGVYMQFRGTSSGMGTEMSRAQAVEALLGTLKGNNTTFTVPGFRSDGARMWMKIVFKVVSFEDSDRCRFVYRNRVTLVVGEEDQPPLFDSEVESVVPVGDLDPASVRASSRTFAPGAEAIWTVQFATRAGKPSLVNRVLRDVDSLGVTTTQTPQDDENDIAARNQNDAERIARAFQQAAQACVR